MSDRHRFAEAAADLGDPAGIVADVATVVLSAFDVAGVAVSTLGDPLGSETVSASDGASARFDEIQIDLAEGPSWQARVERRRIAEPRVQDSRACAWPQALLAFQAAGIGAVYSFPLIVGPIAMGAVTLYSMRRGTLSVRELLDAGLLAAIVARRVLTEALLAAEAPASQNDFESSFSRREVHQATGMVLAQMRITPADALLVLRGHAFTTEQSVMDVAADVIARRLDFTAPPDDPRKSDD